MISPPLRVLFFSHDRRGLGHLRRTLALSEVILDQSVGSNVLVVTGSRMAHSFRTRSGLDYVKLPSITRDADGLYAPTTLGVPLDEVAQIRDELLLQTTRLFRPDVLLVDTPPLGGTSELARTLNYVRTTMLDTAVVLNLRDILDDAARVTEAWERHRVRRTLSELYDLILIHGSREVYDLPEQYGFSEALRAKTLFCGYIPRCADSAAAAEIRSRFCGRRRRLLLVTVGGGVDGAQVIERCLEAVSGISAEQNLHTIAILGPELARHRSDALRARYADDPEITLFDFVDPVTSYFAAADVIVSMGGYNTLSEIAALGKRAIVIPRVHPSAEQLVRARRFAELGLVDMLHPDEAFPSTIAAAITRALRDGAAPAKRLLFGDGGTFVRLVEQIAGATRREDATP